MPRPTRTRRVRGPPSAEAPRPSPAEPENPTAVSSRLGSISSDIYSATPPPAAETTKKASPAPAPVSAPRTRRATRSSTGAAQLAQNTNNAPASEDVSMMSVATVRPDPPSARRGRASRRDTSGIDIDMHDDAGFDGLDSDLDMDLDLEMNDTAELGDGGGGALSATPASASANTSVISVSQFKRRGRSRKPSFTGSDSGQHIRPSSRGPGSTTASTSGFNIGLFRRRAREPSIIGANRRRRAGSVATSNSDVGTDVEKDNAIDDIHDDDDDLDIDMADFQPDAISTPYKKRRSLAQKEPESASREARNLRKRKTLDAHDDTPKQAEKQARREAEPQPDEVEVPASIPPPSSTTIAAATVAAAATIVEVPASLPPLASIEADDDDNLSDISSADDADSLPSPLAARVMRPADRPTTPDRTRDEAALAPPMSGSSSDADTAAWPSIRDVARRRRHVAPTTPIRVRGHAAAGGGSSPLSSPPSLTHSPNYAHAKTGAGKAKARAAAAAKNVPVKVMTAELQSLLPQRRTRMHHADIYDVVDSTGDDESAARGAPRRHDGSRPGSRGRVDGAASASASSATTLAQRKKTQFEPSRRISRTYGVRAAPETEGAGQNGSSASAQAAADDSFQPLVDQDDGIVLQESSSMPDTGGSGGGAEKGNTRELKQAVKKFKEVDKWQMDFEEVTEPSSPPGAR